MQHNKMLEIIAGHQIYGALGEALKESTDYIEATRKQVKFHEKLDYMKLSIKQKDMVDKALEAANESGSQYGRVAYIQGVRDGFKLFLELL